jgi:organic radical activating enzyme
MEKLIFDDLIIEITRKCNMSCNHCLRGEPQNKDIDFKYIDTLLDKTREINCVVFTGGEPSLNPEAINYFVEGCEKRGIYLSHFFIATNTKEVTEKFLMSILKLYCYCDNKNFCMIGISNDQYHEIDENNKELLKAFKFARYRYTNRDDTEKIYVRRGAELINQGRYKENYNNGTDLELSPISIEDESDGRIESNIYLNCNGNIINGCDWSYKNQNSPKRIICHVDDLGIESIINYNQKQFKVEYA